MKKRETYRILSIDGGGIRGLIPAVVLAEIEGRTGKKIAEMFDMVAGTSTGGILAMGLTTPDPEGKPKFSARDLVKLYQEYGKTIFWRNTKKRISSLGGITDEKYSQEGIEKVLKEYFGDTELKDACAELLITSYDLPSRKPYFFKSTKAKAYKERNHLMREAARATSAAPTYFEPLELINDINTMSLIDGGVFANNPAMCAYAEAASMGHSKILLVSIGTGETSNPIFHENAKNWGLIQWIKPLIDIMMDGNSNTVAYQVAQMMRDRPGNAYFRLQTQLDSKSQSMDDVKEENLNRLMALGNQLIYRESDNIAAICNLLVSGDDLIA